MALGSTKTTHSKRAGAYSKSGSKMAAKATRAANKGQCKAAVANLVSAAAYAGMKIAEKEGATPRKRKTLGGKAWKRAYKGLNKTYAKVMAKCAHKK